MDDPIDRPGDDAADRPAVTMRNVSTLTKAEVIDLVSDWAIRLADLDRNKNVDVARATGIDGASIARYRTGVRRPSILDIMRLLTAFVPAIWESRIGPPVQTPGREASPDDWMPRRGGKHIPKLIAGALPQDALLLLELADSIGGNVEASRILLRHLNSARQDNVTRYCRKAPQPINVPHGAGDGGIEPDLPDDQPQGHRAPTTPIVPPRPVSYAGIDLPTEETFSMAQTPELFAAHLGSRMIAKQTVYRWAVNGLRGVILPSVIVAGERRTTRRAVAEFCAALPTAGIPGPLPRSVRPPGPAAGTGGDSAPEGSVPENPAPGPGPQGDVP